MLWQKRFGTDEVTGTSSGTSEDTESRRSRDLEAFELSSNRFGLVIPRVPKLSNVLRAPIPSMRMASSSAARSKRPTDSFSCSSVDSAQVCVDRGQLGEAIQLGSRETWIRLACEWESDAASTRAILKEMNCQEQNKGSKKGNSMPRLSQETKKCPKIEEVNCISAAHDVRVLVLEHQGSNHSTPFNGNDQTGWRELGKVFLWCYFPRWQSLLQC